MAPLMVRYDIGDVSAEIDVTRKTFNDTTGLIALLSYLNDYSLSECMLERELVVSGIEDDTVQGRYMLAGESLDGPVLQHPGEIGAVTRDSRLIVSGAGNYILRR